jgi:CO/xanthine dehydrogenase FAD-binding subunit
MTTSFLAPTQLEQALQLLAEREPPEILAGGTDLWPKWTSGQPRPGRVLSLHRLVELRAVEDRDGQLRIGAACVHAALVRSVAVQRACPALAAAAATIGAAQIQNQATIGGNLANASPAADLPPPLLAAGAEVELCSTAGTRRVPLDHFFLGYRKIDRRPDELLTAVVVPSLPAGSRERFRKIGTRRAQAISKVVGACRLAVGDDGVITAAGIALGSVAATSIRLPELERWLVGRACDARTAASAEEQARQAVRPIDDLRSSAEYRTHVVGRLVYNWVLDR